MSSNEFQKDPVFEEKYSRLRQLINSKYKIQDLIFKYDPSVKNFPKRIVSILNVDDNDPSMFLDYRKNVWKCFSTGKGGGYLELLYWLKVIREQEECNIFSLANQILLSDKEIQTEFGVRSLFKKEIPAVIEPVLRSNTVKKDATQSLAVIFKNLANRKDKKLFYSAFSDFEAGLPRDALIEKYGMYKAIKVVNSETKSLEDLITNLFGGDEN